MHRIALFGEDFAHQEVIGALVSKVADEQGVAVGLDWRSATGGRPRLVDEFERFLRDLERQSDTRPELVVIATDANCLGLNRREREIPSRSLAFPVVKAIPDPHVERWLLLDGAAFKTVFGAGCDAPDLKCARDRYKAQLIRAIQGAGTTPSFGGIEYAADIVREMDLERAGQGDRSFKRFTDALRGVFRGWR